MYKAIFTWSVTLLNNCSLLLQAIFILFLFILTLGTGIPIVHVVMDCFINLLYGNFSLFTSFEYVFLVKY